ncbi:MAG: hypothetical protein IT497_01605 [Ottowia sp.]|nr:hypothetical protein [Ottowia sp.]
MIFHFKPTQKHVLLLTLSTIFLLSACAKRQWVNPANPGAQLPQDSFACQQMAQAHYPVTLVPVTEIDTWSTNQAQQSAERAFKSKHLKHCTPYCPLPTVAPIYKTYYTDANQSPRETFSDSCLAAKGWSHIRVKQ